ncbi:thioredoxin domain-containing protein 5-like [Clavelina lepadiformis]|uniref:Thioredoxin domain-containing protein n=1 Tax=Clavelina lepadiformis TaxID=159417 RepID=A0ABP0FUE8_CLALP
MKLAHLAFLFCLIQFVFSDDSSEIPTPDATADDLYAYSGDDFRGNVPKKTHFIMFFAPWCGHCKKLKPVWEKLSKEINDDENSDVTVIKVDCTKETKLCSDEGVAGYPTLKLYIPDKDPVRYTGGRDIESLKKFITSSINPSDDADIAEHKDGLFDLTDESFNEHIEKGSHFIKFYAPWCGHCRRLEPAWLELAKAHIPSDDDTSSVKIARVDCTAHKTICTEHKIQGYPTLLWFEEGRMTKKYQSSRSIESFESFIKEMSGEKTEPKLVDNVKKPTPKPVVAFQDKQDEQEDDQSLLHLDESNFDFNTAVDVTFVKFYAPWCGFCQRLAPIWEELANEDFSLVKLGVKIAKVDCTENNALCKKYEVKGYPTLLLFKDGNVIEKYSGSRTKDDLKQFVLKHAEQQAEQQTKEEL